MGNRIIFVLMLILFFIAINFKLKIDDLNEKISYLEVRITYLENIISLDDKKE